MKKFYKITEIVEGATRKGEINFIRLEEFTADDERTLVEWSISSKYLDGATLTEAKKEDPDFQKYIKEDIEQVQKDIDKLLELKKALIEENI